ncbi:uncharacterized protein LOC144145120 [Haemaphysalis longicornis]
MEGALKVQVKGTNTCARRSEVRECVQNLFNGQGWVPAKDSQVPLPQEAPEKAKLLAAGCLTYRALVEVPKHGCVPASSIVKTYQCVHDHYEPKDELLQMFRARSKQEYIKFSEQLENCQGTWIRPLNGMRRQGPPGMNGNARALRYP